VGLRSTPPERRNGLDAVTPRPDEFEHEAAGAEFDVTPDPLARLAAEATEPETGVGPAEMDVSRRAPPRRLPDLTTGPIRSGVMLLALPVLGEQLLNAGVAWNDTYLAGHLGAVATAAVGFGAYISWLISLLFSLVGIGATAIIARAVGAGRTRDADEAANQAMTLAVLLALAAIVGMYWLAPPLVRLLGLSASAGPLATRFIRIDLVGYVPESLTFVGAACLRGAGDTRTPMKIMAAVNVINVLATWGLTFGWGPLPELGAVGIAWGTVTARLLGGVLMTIILLRGRGGLRMSTDLLWPHGNWMRRILRIGLPASIDSAIMWSGHFVFLAILTRAPTRWPDDVMFAAHIVGIRIESLSYLPALAWSVAASTMVGQNLGAGNPRRALAAAREARNQAVGLLLLTGSLFFFGAETLFRFLSADPRVIECGVPALRGLAFVQPFVATLIVYLGALRGAGDTTVPMLFTVLGFAGLRIPIAYLGGVVLEGGLVGVWSGMYVDLVARAALMAWRLRSGRWQHARV